MNIKRTFFILSIITMCFSSIYGQTNGVSPYSKLGIGDIVQPHLSFVRNMGGTGIAYTDAYILNPMNPASYGYLKSTAYDIGFYAKLATLEDESSKTSVWSGNISNISLGFPLRNPINDILDKVNKDYSWGMAFNLMPHSLVGYKLQSNDTSEDFGDYTRNYDGNGGTYKFMWGNGLQYKDFSVGMHLGYLFGNITNNRSIVFDYETYAFNNYYTTDYHVSGFIWDLGLLYTFTFDKSMSDKNDKKNINKLTIGLTLNPSTSFSTTSDILNSASYSSSEIRDTLLYINKKEGSGVLPSSIGIGVNYYSGSKWSIGLNYKTENWSKYKNDANPEELSNSYSLSMGGYYRPNAKSYSSFFKRIKYQFGAYYRKDPRLYEDQNIDSYGVTVGMGLPYVFKRSISHANIGFDFGTKGKNTVIKESYIKLNFGFTFNDDNWFVKRKYN